VRPHQLYGTSFSGLGVSILRIVHLLEISYVTVMDSTKTVSVRRANPHKGYGIEVKYTEYGPFIAIPPSFFEYGPYRQYWTNDPARMDMKSYSNGSPVSKYIEEDLQLASDVHLLLQSKDRDDVILCGNDKNAKKKNELFFYIYDRDNEIWKVTNFEGPKIRRFLERFNGLMYQLKTVDAEFLRTDQSD